MRLKSTLDRIPLDRFLMLLILTVILAAVLPARGEAAEALDWITYGAIAFLFFLYGARLSPKAVWAGLMHWRLQGLVFSSTFILFPLIGLAASALASPFLPPELLLGLIFLSVLPSTVQSSIAFTSMAGGNVPAALTSASVSNLLGMIVTPILIVLLASTQQNILSLDSLEKIALQLLAPFVAGQLVRPLIGAWLLRHKTLTSVVDRGSVLIVVYAAFSEGMVAGVWGLLGWEELAIVAGIDILMLAVVLVATTVTSRKLGFSKEDEIAIVFCGSKKSMATGIPMAGILFPGQAMSIIVLPLMLFHQIQLFACATIAQRYARRLTVTPAKLPPEPATGSATLPGAPVLDAAVRDR